MALRQSAAAVINRRSLLLSIPSSVTSELRAYMTNDQILESGRMPRFKPVGRSISKLPAWRLAIAPIVPGGGIKTQPGDYGKGVTVARIDRDPFATAASPKTSKLARAHRDLNQTCCGEGVGHRSGAIVTRVEKRSVAATPAIRLGTKLVGRPNRALHCQRRVRRRIRDTAT